MYAVIFLRRDGKPAESYYYNNFKDAEYHFDLFQGDDSCLYSKIELISEDNETILRTLAF